MGTSHIIVCAWIEVHIICCDYLAVMHYMLLLQLTCVRGLKYEMVHYYCHVHGSQLTCVRGLKFIARRTVKEQMEIINKLENCGLIVKKINAANNRAKKTLEESRSYCPRSDIDIFD